MEAQTEHDHSKCTAEGHKHACECQSISLADSIYKAKDKSEIDALLVKGASFKASAKTLKKWEKLAQARIAELASLQGVS